MRGLLVFALVSGMTAAADFHELQRQTAEKQRQSVRRYNAPAAGGFFVTIWATQWLPPAQPLPQARQTVARADCERIPEEQLRFLTTEAASREGINPLLIRAVIAQESGGRPCAVSDKGAQGLMQLMRGTQQDLNVSNPFDPAENIGGGARYLRELLARYRGDLRLTLAAYNAGPQRVEPGGQMPDIAETRAYVASVMAALENSEQPEP